MVKGKIRFRHQRKFTEHEGRWKQVFMICLVEEENA